MVDIESEDINISTWGEVQRNWKWLLLLGLFFVVAGTAGVVATPLMTITSVLLFGFLLLSGGLLQLLQALRVTKGWKSRTPHILGGLFYVVAGVLTIINPIASSMALTILLGASLFTSAILKIVIAIQHKGKMKNWTLLLVSGLGSLFLAVLIAASWPYSALWTLGLFISLDMIFSGWSHIMLALAAKRLSQNSKK